MPKSKLGNRRTGEELRGVVPPPDYAAAEMPPSVTHLIGANTGPTLWALRQQGRRDVENGRQREVSFGIVLAYAEQAVDEAVAYLHTRMEQRAAAFTSKLAFAFAIGIAIGIATGLAL